MTTETGSLGNLIQGVSQQTPRDRLEGQVSAQENMTSDPVDGISRRGSMDYIETLLSSEGDQWHWTDFTLKSVDFVLGWRAGEIKVFTLAGVEVPVTASAPDLAYVSGSREMRFLSLDGTVYTVNPATTVQMRADTNTDYCKGKAVVYVLGANYGRTYSIKVEAKGFSTEQSYLMPNGSQASHAEQATSTNIATQLETLLLADTVFTSDMGMTISRQGDVLLIEFSDSADDDEPFTITTEDGTSGTVMRHFTDNVSDVSRLSRYAPHKMLVRVEGDKSDGADDFFMQFLSDTETVTGAGFGTDGKWVETLGPGQLLGFDPATMPHTLTGDATGMTFVPGTWKDRRVGDDVTNEDPSFVGKEIADVFSFQSRLGFLAGPNVIMSRTNKPDDFWKESATENSATDPIDVKSTAKDVTGLKAAIPHNRDLVVFGSPKAQFIVFGRNALTPDNASLVLTTEFDAQTKARPVAAGRNVFFAFPAGRYSGIKEFYTEGTSDVNDARPVTEHVPKYLRGEVFSMAASTNFDTLVVRMDEAQNDVFVYRYLWSGQQKLQSSWGRWTLPTTARHLFFRESTLYTITERGGFAYLASIDLDPDEDDGVEFNIRLDMKQRVPVTDQWLIDVDPAKFDAGAYPIETLRVVRGPDDEHAGMSVEVLDILAGQIRLSEYVTGDVYIGERFRSEFTPTMPMKKDRNGEKKSRTNLIVTDFDVSFEETGHLAVTSTSKDRDGWTLEFEGRVVGSADNLLGVVAVTSGVFSFPFGEDADLADITIWTDHHTPMTIPDIEYRAQVLTTGRSR